VSKLLAGVFLALVLAPVAQAYQQGKDCPLYPLPKEPTGPPAEKPKSKDPPTRTPTPPSTTEGSGRTRADAPAAAVIAWSSSADDAQKAVQESKGVYALFFCDAKTAVVAGEGPQAWEKFKKENRGLASPTIFDTPVVLAEFSRAGIASFAKVPLTEANRELYKKYNAGVPTLVICSADGKALQTFAGAECKQTQVVKYLQTAFKRP
jgi:hypothetical protein